MGLANGIKSLEPKMRNRKQKITCPHLRKFIVSLHNMAEKPAKGFMTVKQWAKKWDYDNSYCRRVLKKMVIGKIFESRQYRLPVNGFPTSTTHFGPVGKGK